MSQPGNDGRLWQTCVNPNCSNAEPAYWHSHEVFTGIPYLLDEHAVDVSRMTGIPWSMERVESRGPRRPFLDLTRLDAIDRLRVAFSLVGGYYYLDNHM